MPKLTEILDATPIVTTTQLRAAGLHESFIRNAIEAGEVHRIGHGIIVTPDVYADPRLDDALACQRTGGVIAHLTAAMRHGLCDAMPPLIEVIVPASVSQAPRRWPVRILRTRNPAALTEGVDAEPFHNLEIRMTTPARTVIDLYRIDPLSTRQHALASLVRYLRDDMPIGELERLARLFRVHDVLRPEIDAAQEVLEQGFKP